MSLTVTDLFCGAGGSMPCDRCDGDGTVEGEECPWCAGPGRTQRPDAFGNYESCPIPDCEDGTVALEEDGS